MTHRVSVSGLALLNGDTTSDALRLGWRGVAFIRSVAVVLGLASAGIWLVRSLRQRLEQRARPTFLEWWLLGAGFVALRLVLTPEERLQGEEVLMLAVLVLPPVFKAAGQAWTALYAHAAGGLKAILVRLAFVSLRLWLLAFALTCVGRFTLVHQGDFRLALLMHAVRGFGEIACLSMHVSVALFLACKASAKAPRRFAVVAYAVLASGALLLGTANILWTPPRLTLAHGMVAWGIGVLTFPTWLTVLLLALGAITLIAWALVARAGTEIQDSSERLGLRAASAQPSDGMTVGCRGRAWGQGVEVPENAPPSDSRARLLALRLSQWALLLAAGAMPLNGTGIVYLMLASAPALLQQRALGSAPAARGAAGVPVSGPGT